MENQNDINNQALEFDYHVSEENRSIIKVVGVGGGGSNAVQHMYNSGINDVSFLIINTDKQALKGSSIPNKLLISDKGLGAGAKPQIAHDFAVQYTEQIQNALNDGTEMVFITAGMGGGTGTGAAPVVAQIAHDMGILTVGIVTIPFRFEGRKKIKMALEGVSAIEQYCDALLVVNNNRLIDIFPDLTFGNAFAKADDTLTMAAKSISDIINVQGYVNLDFADVSTTLRNGGVALISTGTASGENRLSKAIQAATTSPLLQDNNINDSKHLLFELCFSHEKALSMSEIAEMNDFVDQLNKDIEVIWGAMYDDSLGDEVRIIILASGFSMNHSTGSVYAANTMQQKVKDMQQQLRLAIVKKQEQLDEFAAYPEAYDILLSALQQATDKANNFTPDDELDDELAKLDIAHSRASEKKQEIIDAEHQKKIKDEERKRRQLIEEQIAALQQKLKTPIAATVETQLATTPETKTESTETPASPEMLVTVETPVVAETPEAIAQAPTVTETPIVTETPKVAITTVEPAATTDEGIDRIRQFYGEEAVNKFMLSDARKAYYVLDDQDLTNEELIHRLEALPAYKRTLEDLGQLRAISRKPAQPRPLSGHNEGPDGTIKF